MGASSFHGRLGLFHEANPVGADVLAGGCLGVDKGGLDGDFESAGGLGVSLESVSEFVFAEFGVHVRHRFDSVLAVASSATVLELD